VGACRGGDDLGLVRPGAAVGDVLGDARREEDRLLEDIGELPALRPRSVVLPAPVGPTIPTQTPGGTSNETSSSTRRRPPRAYRRR
jgi:hypothetical protein